MPAAGPRRRAAGGDGAIDLSDLFASVSRAALEAKALLDQEAAAVAEEYARSPARGLLSPPSFAIGEVRLVIRCAVAEVEAAPTRGREERRPPRVAVRVDTATLADTAPHLISELEVRIVPEVRRPQAAEDEIESAG